MAKILDVDALFDKYIESYVYSNIGKVKPEEIENRIPELYVEFGDKALEELDGKTPNTYYKDFPGEELLDCLKAHLSGNVPVSDFLCEAITGNPNNEDVLVNALKGEESEEFLLYVMNMLGDMQSVKPAKRYLEFIVWDFSETIREVATECLTDMAELVKEDILAQFNDVDEVRKACLTDVLSNCKNDDRVFDILISEFEKHQDNIPLYSAYLGKFGDNRALPYLMETIERENLTYADFEELRFAIEALGGEYTKERDFSKDKSFKKIKQIKN